MRPAKTLLVALLACALPATAQPMTVVTSDQASKSAFITNKGINWYKDLESAQDSARRAHKLVFWVHMLGSIDGET